MSHLPPAHRETSKRDSPNELKVKKKQKQKLSRIRIQTLPVNDSSHSNQVTVHLVSQGQKGHFTCIASTRWVGADLPSRRGWATQKRDENEPKIQGLGTKLAASTVFFFKTGMSFIKLEEQELQTKGI
jgi:hypothetical protein